MRRWCVAVLCAFILAGCGAADVTSEPLPPTQVVQSTAVPAESGSIPTSEPTSEPISDSASAPVAVPQNPACVDVTQFPAEPDMLLDMSKEYQATLKTDKGDVVIELYPQFAPRTVNSFVFLAREGYYDDVTFHRVLPGFVAQTGDPSATGMCGPGYEFANEFDPTSGLDYTKAGVVGMANSGPDTNGSQFFITYGDAGLPAQSYTIFGQVVSGQDVLEQITPRDPSINPGAAPGDLLYTIEITEK